MPDNGSGTYTLLRSMSADDAAGIKILSTNFDKQHDDIATALNNRLTKDGTDTAGANLKMGGYKHTSVANATARNQYLSFGQAYDGQTIYCSASASANEIKLVSVVTCSSLVKGMTLAFVATSTNTGAATLKIDALTAATLQKNGGALTSGDVISGGAYVVTYDGTQFQLHGPPAGTVDRAGVLEVATTAETTAGTDTARAVTPAGLAAALAAGSDGTFADVSASAVNLTGGITVGTVVSASSDVVAGGSFVGQGDKITMKITEYDASRTMATADEGAFLIYTSGASIKMSIPSSASVAIPVGAGCVFTQRGAGEARVSAAAGVTINKEVGLRCNAQHAVGGIIKTSADAWSAFGSLKA